MCMTFLCEAQPSGPRVMPLFPNSYLIYPCYSNYSYLNDDWHYFLWQNGDIGLYSSHSSFGWLARNRNDKEYNKVHILYNDLWLKSTSSKWGSTQISIWRYLTRFCFPISCFRNYYKIQNDHISPSLWNRALTQHVKLIVCHCFFQV